MAQDNYWSRSMNGRISRRRALRGAAIGGVGLAGAALIGCGSEDDSPGTGTPTGTPGTGGTASPTPAASDDPYPDVRRGGTLVTTLTGDPPTIDIYGNNSFHTKTYAGYPYSRLFKLGTGEDIAAGEAEPVPDLAESVETDDGLRWVVKIRPGVKFHNKPPVDGRELVADDLSFSWDQFNDERNILREGLSWVSSVDVVDDTTMVFNLEEPRSAFLDALADGNLFWVVPGEADGGFNLATDAIGTGPWVLQDYRTGVQFDWAANPDYYIEGAPFLDGIRQSIIPEYANSLAQFQAGNTHVQGINANDVLGLRDQQPNVQWRGDVSALTSFFFFDHIMDPNNPWSDDRVRIAASMAIDRDAITDLGYNVNALQQAGLDVSTAWNNYVPVGQTRWWLDPQSEAHGPSGANFQYNPQEARALLEAVSPGGLPIKYQYTANAYGATFNSIAEANIGYLQEAGFQIETEIQDYSAVYITQTGDGNFSGMAFGYETPFPEVSPYMERAFGVDENGEPLLKNRSKVIDERILDIARRQATELVFEDRRELIHEFQRINGEHMYYVPNQAGAGTSFTAYHPAVRGIRSTRGYGVASEVRIWMWLDQ